MSANPIISIMGNCLGRGTIISIVLVLGVLPSILVLGDSIIERTSFKFKTPERKKLQTNTGTMKLNGHVKGYVCGMVDADFTGSLKGELSASVTTEEGLPLPPDIPELDAGSPADRTEGGEDHE